MHITLLFNNCDEYNNFRIVGTFLMNAFVYLEAGIISGNENEIILFCGVVVGHENRVALDNVYFVL